VLAENPFEDCLFIFTNRSRSAVKCLYWDRTGFALWVKALERDRFPWPRGAGEKTLSLTHEQLAWLLQGIDIWKLRQHAELHYSRIV
jgi:transposase